MKVKLDENLPAEIADDFAAAGHDAHTVTMEDLSGAEDLVVLMRAKAEQRTFVTMDKGIGDIRRYPPANYAGLVLLRPPASGREAVREFVRIRIGQIAARANQNFASPRPR